MSASPVGAGTRVAGVIGDPVRHSASPALHNAAYAALGLDYVYVAFAVPAGQGGDAVRAMPVLGLVGLNVTMPHKADAALACDELSPAAAMLGKQCDTDLEGQRVRDEVPGHPPRTGSVRLDGQERRVVTDQSVLMPAPLKVADSVHAEPK